MATSELGLPTLAQTLLIPLVARALESQRADSLIRDPKASEIVASLELDPMRMRPSTEDQVTICMRARRFDEHAHAFLESFPSGVIVEIGCGLDTRFSRVDNGRVRWFDLDLPEVIELRRRFFEETDRCRFLSGSVLDEEWIGPVRSCGGPFLFLAEGVFPYFRAEDVRRCVLTLRARFPGSELVFDGMSPILLRLHNLQLMGRRMAARLRWSMRTPRDLEGWGPEICLLDEWTYFAAPNPRLGASNLLGRVPFLARAAGIYHYRLGTTGS